MFNADRVSIETNYPHFAHRKHRRGACQAASSDRFVSTPDRLVGRCGAAGDQRQIQYCDSILQLEILAGLPPSVANIGDPTVWYLNESSMRAM